MRKHAPPQVPDPDFCTGTVGSFLFIFWAVIMRRDVPAVYNNIQAKGGVMERLSGTHERNEELTGLAACPCLNWRDLYRHQNVTCGQSYELSTFGIGPVKGGFSKQWRDAPKEVFHAWCTEFFHKINDNYCVKFGIDAQELAWCYTSPLCSGLGNTVEKVDGADLQFRLCSASAGDTLLRDLQPEQLNKLAAKDKLDLGLVGHFAYPSFSPEKWSSAYMFWAKNTPEERANAIPDANLRARLQAVMDSKKPHLFEAEDTSGGGAIVIGTRVYSYMPKLEGLDGDGGAEYLCMKNCD